MITHQHCPNCGHNDCLTINDDGSTFCHSECGYTPPKKKEPTMHTTLKEISLPYRSIPQSVVDFYKIKTGVTDEGEQVYRAYPYPQGNKYRYLPKDFSKNAGFKNIELFGMDLFNAGTSKFITIVEGEDDAPSAYFMLGEKYPVVSLPGAGVSKALLKNCHDFLDKFEQIILCTDGDAAGDKAAGVIAGAFPNKTYRVSLTKHKDANDFLTNGDNKDFLFAWVNRQKYVPKGTYNTQEQFATILREEEMNEYVPTPCYQLNDMIKGLMRGHLTVMTGPEGQGKQLPNTTPIPTPTGFKSLGDLQVGDVIYGADGKETTVTYITETQYDVPCFELEFADGSKQIAGGPHKWGVLDTDGVYRVKTTDEIVSEGVKRKDVCLYSVPLSEAIEGIWADVSIDPYSLGVWLGDGHSYSADICVGFSDSLQFEKLHDVTFKRKDRTAYTYRVEKVTHKMLDSAGLLRNKHIPEVYQWASIGQRMSLLQGLMDTDGGVDSLGSCKFYSSNKTLAFDTLRLIRGLGYKAKITSKMSKLYGKECGVAYTITFSAYSTLGVPFKYERKVKKVKFRDGRLGRTKTIRSVTPVSSVPSRCLTVDNESHLFLCGDHFTVTHNTEIMRWFEWNILKNHPDTPIAVLHMEESKKVCLTSYACYELGVNLRDPDHTVPMKDVEDAIAGLTKSENLYLFDFGTDEDPLTILDKVRYFSEVCGCHYVFIDPIQQLSYGKDKNDTEEKTLSHIAVKLEALATELNVGIVLTTHVNDDGQTRSSRMIGKSASVRIDLTRDHMDPDDEVRNTTKLSVSKNRPTSKTGYGGSVIFDMDTFTLRDM